MKPAVLIVGAGGHGRSVLEALRLAGEQAVLGFVDDTAAVGADILGTPVLGATATLGQWREQAAEVVVAIGNNARRAELCELALSLGYRLALVVHPRAFVSPTAVLGPGTAVMANATVGTEARLGRGTIVNCGAVVDHHAEVGDFGHLGVGAHMAGSTRLGRGAWMQAGSALGYGVQVPDGTVLAPGQGLGQ